MNIGEIARGSGVSRSTVSYALSGKRSVAGPTRRRIQEAIGELGYWAEFLRFQAQGISALGFFAADLVNLITGSQPRSRISEAAAGFMEPRRHHDQLLK